MTSTAILASDRDKAAEWKEALEQAGFSVISIKSEKRAVQLVSSVPVDLILIDVQFLYRSPVLKSVLKLHCYKTPQLLVDESGVHAHWCPPAEPGCKSKTCGYSGARNKESARQDLEARMARILEPHKPGQPSRRAG
jgi:hypothetical protein